MTPGDLHVSEHARERWADRVRVDYGGALLGALATAIEAPYQVCRRKYDRDGSRHPDCYLAHVAAGVVFVVRGGVVVTTLPMSFEVMEAMGAEDLRALVRNRGRGAG